MRYSSPIGVLDLRAYAGKLVEVCFGSAKPLQSTSALVSPEDQAVLDTACQQLDGYFAGQRQRFDIPISLRGSTFQIQVWSALCQIPFGQTASYRRITDAIGRGCPRAVGSANGANPLPIFVPCHRVIQSDGSLGGYAGGTDAKQHLLDLESLNSGLVSAD